MIYLRIYKELLSASNYIIMPIKKTKPKKPKKDKVPKKDKKKKGLIENNITINVQGGQGGSGSGSGGGGGKGGKGGKSGGVGGRRGNTGGGKSGKDGTSNVVSGVSTGGLNGPDNAGYLAPNIPRYREPQPYSNKKEDKKEDNNDVISRITGLLENGQYNNKLVTDRIASVENNVNNTILLLTDIQDKAKNHLLEQEQKQQQQQTQYTDWYNDEDEIVIDRSKKKSNGPKIRVQPESRADYMR
jgi:hypothetical protein